MNCPKCQQPYVAHEVSAIAKANVCHRCGWIETTSLTFEANQPVPQKSPSPSLDPATHTCFMCGENRERLNSKGFRLILGVAGGICSRCVPLAQKVLQEEEMKKPSLP